MIYTLKKDFTSLYINCSDGLNISPIFNPKPPLKSREVLLFENLLKFPARRLPVPEIRDNFLFYSMYGEL